MCLYTLNTAAVTEQHESPQAYWYLLGYIYYSTVSPTHTVILTIRHRYRIILLLPTSEHCYQRENVKLTLDQRIGRVNLIILLPSDRRYNIATTWSDNSTAGQG
jgi:hypothetical protein